MYLFISTGAEGNHYSMTPVGHLLSDGEVVVELDDEIVAEILWNAPAVLYGITGDTPFLSVGDYVCLTVEGINDDVSLPGLREGEAHHGSPLGGCNLSRYIPVGQIDLIIIRCGSLSLV